MKYTIFFRTEKKNNQILEILNELEPLKYRYYKYNDGLIYKYQIDIKTTKKVIIEVFNQIKKLNYNCFHIITNNKLKERYNSLKKYEFCRVFCHPEKLKELKNKGII